MLRSQLGREFAFGCKLLADGRSGKAFVGEKGKKRPEQIIASHKFVLIALIKIICCNIIRNAEIDFASLGTRSSPPRAEGGKGKGHAGSSSSSPSTEEQFNEENFSILESVFGSQRRAPRIPPRESEPLSIAATRNFIKRNFNFTMYIKNGTAKASCVTSILSSTFFYVAPAFVSQMRIKFYAKMKLP
jgi:hypothetical protein